MQACPIPTQVWDDPTRTVESYPILWPVDLESCCKDLNATEAQRFLAAAAASDALWQKTGRVYSACARTIYPCARQCSCFGACNGCCDWRRYDLTDYVSDPIRSIVSVTLSPAGVPAVVDPATYRFTNGRYLVPKRDSLLWNCSIGQDLNFGTGADTWSMIVNVGELVPPILLLAANELATQFIKFCMSQPCDVPPNAVSVTRDGVTISLETGLKSLPLVKMALEVYGEKPPRPRSRIVDPSTWCETQLT